MAFFPFFIFSICSELSSRECLFEQRTVLQREADFQSRRVSGGSTETYNDIAQYPQRVRRKISAPARVYQSLFSVADV